MSNLLRFPHKKIRAKIIKKYMEEAGYEKAVCFSCGNAARELQAAGVPTIHVGAKGMLNPTTWFSQAEVHNTFPDRFDATSGHLPMDLMLRIAQKYKEYLGELEGRIYVPTGSGETLVCLKLAYPDVDFIAVYNLDEATKYSSDAPLNDLVEELASETIFVNWETGDEIPY